MRTAILLAALLGCLAGVGEAAVVALGTGRPAQFTHLVGYAVLTNAVVFAIIGGVAAAAWALLCRARGSCLQPRQVLGVWLPVGFLMTAMLLVGSVLRLSGFCPGCGGGHARSGLLVLQWLRSGNGGPNVNPLHVLSIGLVILGAPALGMLLSRGLARFNLSWVGRSHALPLGVAACLVAATGLVAGDLSGRGLDIQRSAPATPQRSDAVRAAGTPQSRPLTTPVDQAPALDANQAAPSHAVAVAGAAAAPRDDRPPEQPRRAPSEQPTRPNILLITVDTLRADALGIYGNRRASTPTMDRLGAEGVVFLNAVAPQPNTNAAHASLFTGAYPATHGLRVHMVDTLPDQMATLGEQLDSSGYTAGGIFSWVSLEDAYSGLQRGFTTYENYAVNVPSYLSSRPLQALSAGYKTIVSRLSLPGLFDQTVGAARRVEDVLDGKADVTTDAAIDWLQERGRQPFFLWVHYFDPHYPYSPPAPYDTLFGDPCVGCVDGSMQTIDAVLTGRELSAQDIERLIDLYSGEVSFTDQEIGRLMRALDEMGLTDRTVIALTGDHGESFGEHGLWVHGLGLYQSDMRVPLLIRYPFGIPEGRVVDAPASLVDVMPTVLDLVRVPVPRTVEGESLLPLISGQEDGDARVAVATVDERDSLLALYWRNWKLILDTTTWQAELYDLARDPVEQHNLAAERPEVAAEMRRMLDQWKATH